MKKQLSKGLFIVCILIAVQSFGQKKILFDFTKSQTCGDADWVIDADLNNLSYISGLPVPTFSGTASNAQRFPTPAQSGITASTPESYWKGGISAWGVACAKKGWQVETLPYTASLTYGNSSNPQDLKNYDVYINCEPNVLFTAAEKAAMLAFVKNGGGLFLIANHNGSDRNFDGPDALRVWNDFFRYPGVDSIGLAFDSVVFSQTSTNKATFPSTDTLVFGSFGNVGSVQWSSGTTMKLFPAKNPTVKGVFYKTGSSTTGTTNCMVARANLGHGKVVAFADSSPFDDGTGDSNDQLFDGWATDASGNHQRLIMNATLWLLNTTKLNVGIAETELTDVAFYPNPANDFINIQSTNRLDKIAIYDILGSEKIILNSPENIENIDISQLANGIYWAKMTAGSKTKIVKFIKQPHN